MKEEQVTTWLDRIKVKFTSAQDTINETANQITKTVIDKVEEFKTRVTKENQTMVDTITTAPMTKLSYLDRLKTKGII